jgi:hypothetical protein
MIKKSRQKYGHPYEKQALIGHGIISRDAHLMR